MTDKPSCGDKPREACGVFGIYGPGEDVARITFFGLYALQHRGQESAGIVTGDRTCLHGHAQMGLVAQVFTEEDLATLHGHIAIGHTRYSTTGSSRACNVQPIVVHGPHGEIALGHNGNLVNYLLLRDELAREGHEFVTTTDSEIIALLIAHAPGDDWIRRVRSAMARMTGAFSVVVNTPHELIAFRDPLGVRPLCLGRMRDAWLVSSESCALDTVGAEYVREIEPGEIVRIDENGVQSDLMRGPHPQAMCLFEYIYFARPDSTISQRLVHQARQAMGRQLARECPADADIVIAVPDSATPAGIGFAEESGIPYAEGLVKNRYIGRTFIQPDQRLRERGVSLKYNPLPEVLAGKRVVVVDDSIVRGTTTRPIVRLLRRAGAREIHVRIHAPPMMHPCYLGVDLARRSELIAALMTVPEICTHIEADTLGYLSLSGLIRAIQRNGAHLCDGCFTGRYPVSVHAAVDKFALERA